MIMIEYKYLRILIENIGIVGGNDEDSNSIIRRGLLNIQYSFDKLNISSSEQQYIELTSFAYEQTEEEGGVEEIQSHLFHSTSDRVNVIQAYAKCTIIEMTNTFKFSTK